jgi:hypothetical protein
VPISPKFHSVVRSRVRAESIPPAKRAAQKETEKPAMFKANPINKRAMSAHAGDVGIPLVAKTPRLSIAVRSAQLSPQYSDASLQHDVKLSTAARSASRPPPSASKPAPTSVAPGTTKVRVLLFLECD